MRLVTGKAKIRKGKKDSQTKRPIETLVCCYDHDNLLSTAKYTEYLVKSRKHCPCVSNCDQDDVRKVVMFQSDSEETIEGDAYYVIKR